MTRQSTADCQHLTIEDLMTTEVIVKQDDDAPVPVEVLAASIKAISEGVKKLRAGPLNEDALVLLLVNATPAIYQGYKRVNLTGKHVRAVLSGMESLEKSFLKVKKDSKASK